MSEAPQSGGDDGKPKRRFPLVVFAPLAILLVLVAVAVSRLSDPEVPTSSFTSPMRPAPDIAIPGIDGGSFNFAKDRNGPVLVNFFASWCTPCRAEHPVLMVMKEQGVPIVGVLHKDKVELGRDLLARDGDPFKQVVLDPSGDVSLAFGISGVPESFLVDANGQIVKTIRGPIVDQKTMQAFIDAYRAELAKWSPPAQPAAPPAG